MSRTPSHGCLPTLSKASTWLPCQALRYTRNDKEKKKKLVRRNFSEADTRAGFKIHDHRSFSFWKIPWLRCRCLLFWPHPPRCRFIVLKIVIYGSPILAANCDFMLIQPIYRIGRTLCHFWIDIKATLLNVWRIAAVIKTCATCSISISIFRLWMSIAVMTVFIET